MDYEKLFLFLSPIVTAVLGYFVKGVVDDVKALSKTFNDFRTEVPEKYATKYDVNRDVDKVLEAINELGKKLDSIMGSRRSTDVK